MGTKRWVPKRQALCQHQLKNMIFFLTSVGNHLSHSDSDSVAIVAIVALH